MGGDFQAGALSAGMNELLSPYMKVDAKKSGVTQSRANEIEQAMSGFVGGVSAGAVSGESQIGIGSAIAQSATQYNRQLHEKEIKFIEENADKYAQQKGISPEEAKQELAQEALRLSDSLWASMLGESNEEAKAFLTANLDSLASITTLERDNPFDGLSNIASNQDNIDFYRQNVYSGVQKDIATVYNEKAEVIYKKIASLDTDKAKELGSQIAKNISDYIDKTPVSQMSKDLKNALVSTAEDVATNGKKITDLLNTNSSDIQKVYNIDSKDVEILRSVVQAESIIALAGMGTSGTLKKSATKEVFEDVGKSVDNLGKNILDNQPWKYSNRIDTKKFSAEEINTKYFNDGYTPPYKAGTQVVEYTTKEADTFVRVHGSSNQARSWMMRKEAIEGLSAKEIQKKYSLPVEPTSISDVYVPAGSKIRMGTVESNFGGNSGATQYQWISDTKLPEEAFRNERSIQ